MREYRLEMFDDYSESWELIRISDDIEALQIYYWLLHLIFPGSGFRIIKVIQIV